MPFYVMDIRYEGDVLAVLRFLCKMDSVVLAYFHLLDFDSISPKGIIVIPLDFRSFVFMYGLNGH